MIISRHSAATLLALAALVMAGYSVFNSSPRSSVTPTFESTLEEIKRTRTLKAAYVPYPPFVSVDPKTQLPSGYFIDFMSHISKEGGFTIHYEEASLATMVVGLNTGKYDVVVSAIHSTVPRAKEVEFTTPVLYIGMSAVARVDDHRIQSEADLRKAGLRFAVLVGGSGQQYLLENLPDAKRIEFVSTDTSKPMLEVLAGRADLALVGSVVCANFVAAHPEARDVFAGNPYAMYGGCLIVRSNDDDWREFLNVTIDQSLINGTFDRLDKKYKVDVSSHDWYSRALPWRRSNEK